MKLSREFYNRDAHVVAKELLGKLLVRKSAEGIVKGRIVEVEVYKGTVDSMDHACHAFPMKRTDRTEIMFGEAGHAYIFYVEDDYVMSERVSDEPGLCNVHADTFCTIAEIKASKRVNIDYAQEAVDFLWRYTIAGHPFLSVKEKTQTPAQRS